MRGFRQTLYLGLALLTLPGVGAAQTWFVDASAGAAEYDAVGGEVGSLNAIVGVRREGPTWLSVSAGLPLDSAGIPWMTAGGGRRLVGRLGALQFGVDLGAIGFGYQVSELDASGGGATLRGLPFVGLDGGTARVELRSGVLHHTSIFDGESESRTIHDTGLRASLNLSTMVSVQVDGRLVRDAESIYPFAGVGMEFARGPAVAWLRVGRWTADELEATGWGAGARMALRGRWVIRAGYERETDDPLYWNGPHSGWTVGLSRSLGPRLGAGVIAPVAESVRQQAGTVALRIPVGESPEAPSIAGDFTDWNTVSMRRAGGFWEASFDLPSGVYHYSFIRPDGSWFLPDSIQNRVDDGFGGLNAVLVVGP